jgi:hypothetical protein
VLPAVSLKNLVIKELISKKINHGSRIRITITAFALFPAICGWSNGKEFRKKILALVLNRHSIAAGGPNNPALFAG